jgi:alpha-beta hydrolase superfamily lysophospholipase
VIEHDLALHGRVAEVTARLWLPGGAARGLVQLVHGWGEHGGRYAHVAAALVARGWAVVADDHLGHGRSGGERVRITDFEGVVDDLRAVTSAARVRAPDGPLVLAGHSMGGLLTARYGQRHPDEVAGVAFLGAVLDCGWLREVVAGPPPTEPSDPAGTSRDPAAQRAYADDPLVYHGPVKMDLIRAELACCETMVTERHRLTMAGAFLHGTDDPFVPWQPALASFEAMPLSPATVHVYPGARHELVHETHRHEVIADLVAFVESTAG